MNNLDVVIIGAGAAGLFCAIEAGKRGRKVVVIEHANKPGKKILMSGGGRCNFTNYHIHPDCYLSHNPHFCKSALKRYTQWDFIELVNKHGIPFHEKTLGQLFCDEKSKAILNMLLAECNKAGVEIHLETEITKITKVDNNSFQLSTTRGEYFCESLVAACGGLSIPTMGASPFGYKIAEQFGINVWPTRAGLVPLTLHDHDKARFEELSGVSFNSLVSNEKINFRENTLFTHRGLSGPAILQISSYWQAGEALSINMSPDINLETELKLAKSQYPTKLLKNVLSEYLPKRLIEVIIAREIADIRITELSHQALEKIADSINDWQVKPNGTEGYRTAEVTLGGVDCNALSSVTMQVNDVPGLYFIGEVVDVTGWLGGYNFQWAWSSGWAAGQVA
jgi:predicted Rossmann fold flavoprotein